MRDTSIKITDSRNFINPFAKEKEKQEEKERPENSEHSEHSEHPADIPKQE